MLLAAASGEATRTRPGLPQVVCVSAKPGFMVLQLLTGPEARPLGAVRTGRRGGVRKDSQQAEAVRAGEGLVPGDRVLSQSRTRAVKAEIEAECGSAGRSHAHLCQPAERKRKIRSHG